ncbi:MAG TPA: hypothetical protein VGH15_08205 [Caulobacteraceae bacterium]|jgi:hypothetical protein
MRNTIGRRIFAAAFASACGVAFHGLADPAPSGNLVTRPVWSQNLDPVSLNTFYPDSAETHGVEGYAIIGCVVSEAGRLTDCSVTSEQPRRFGFGFALLNASHNLTVSRLDEQGQPTAGRPIKLGAQFGRLKGRKRDDDQPFGVNLYVVGD